MSIKTKTPREIIATVVAIVAVSTFGISVAALTGAGLLWAMGALGIVAIPVTFPTVSATVLLALLFFVLVAGVKAL